MLSKPRRNLQTQAIVDPSSILLKSLEKISMKYCTSESFHFSHSINNAIKGNNEVKKAKEAVWRQQFETWSAIETNNF